MRVLLSSHTTFQSRFKLMDIIGDKLTIDFVLDPDHAKTTTTFKVGEPEDNTQDKDDLPSKTFTKYLLLKKSSVRF